MFSHSMILKMSIQISTLPNLKQLWDGIVKFNRTDPSVLSSDPAVHIQKVIAGNYAYVADKTYIDLAMAEHCGLALVTANILAIPLGVGLPNHSPLRQVFSDQ